MVRRLAILGASGHGKVVADTAISAGWDEVVFFDDTWPELSENGAWPVIGNTAELIHNVEKYNGVIVAIGDNRTRLDKARNLINKGANLVTVIHPSAEISRSSVIGIGSVVFAGVVINIDTRLGVAAIVNTGSTIDHDCKLGNGVHVSPGAHLAGDVTVGDLTWIGIGACVHQSIEIGERVIVGAGAVVINNVHDNLTVVGVPAVPMHENERNK